MMWSPDPIEPEPPKQTISGERVIAWAKETLELLKPLPDANGVVEKACPTCGATILHFQGRHSGKMLVRHTRAGCMPNGDWSQ